MLGLLKGFGAGMFCLGVAVCFIAFEPLRHGVTTACWFLAFISVLYTSMLVHVTRQALLTGAAPILVTIAMTVVCVAAAAASIVAQYSLM